MTRLQRQRKRLAELIDEAGSQKELAERVKTAESYISQLMTARAGIARKFCVRLEKAMKKPDGWMDQWLPEETDPNILRTMFEEILQASAAKRDPDDSKTS